AEGVVTHAAGAGDDLADAARRVERAGGGLGREALVVVLVVRDDDIGAGIVQRLPQRLGGRGAAVLAARAEARVVPVGESAARRVPGEIDTEPLPCRGAGGAGVVPVGEVMWHGPEVVALVPFP